MVKRNDWMVGKSILTGVGLTLLVMVIPEVRDMAVKFTGKISSVVGL